MQALATPEIDLQQFASLLDQPTEADLPDVPENELVALQWSELAEAASTTAQGLLEGHLRLGLLLDAAEQKAGAILADRREARRRVADAAGISDGNARAHIRAVRLFQIRDPEQVPWPQLSWSHLTEATDRLARIAAPLEERRELAERFLNEAADEHWRVSDLRDAIAATVDERERPQAQPSPRPPLPPPLAEDDLIRGCFIALVLDGLEQRFRADEPGGYSTMVSCVEQHLRTRWPVMTGTFDVRRREG